MRLLLVLSFSSRCSHLESVFLRAPCLWQRWVSWCRLRGFRTRFRILGVAVSTADTCSHVEMEFSYELLVSGLLVLCRGAMQKF